MNCPKCRFVLPDDKAAECPFCHAGLRAGAAPPSGVPPPIPAAGLPDIPPIPFGAPTPAPRPVALTPPPPMPAPQPSMQAPPALPGLAPPGFPGLLPPSMPHAGSSAPAGVNPDPLNLEGLNRAAPPAPAPLGDPLDDPLAFPLPMAAPRAAAPPPTMAASPMKAGEIEFEAPPPPSKTSGKNFAMFAVLAVVGIGYQSGFLSLDAFYNMLSKGSATPTPIEPLPPTGQTPIQTPRPDWKRTAPVAPTPTPTAALPDPDEGEPEPAMAVEKWTFEGRIYDMLTLRPVFAAEVRLQPKEGKPLAVQTDENGRYRIQVPALDGGSYQLAIVHPDYDKKRYFDEISPPYKELELQDRKALVRLVPRHRPWTGKVKGRTRRDLVLLPATHSIQVKDETPSLDSGLETDTDAQ